MDQIDFDGLAGLPEDGELNTLANDAASIPASDSVCTDERQIAAKDEVHEILSDIVPLPEGRKRTGRTRAEQAKYARDCRKSKKQEKNHNS